MYVLRVLFLYFVRSILSSFFLYGKLSVFIYFVCSLLC